MSAIDILLISIGMAMDSFAVSVCKGLSIKKAGIPEGVKCGIYFGGFQALMPVIGYYLGKLFEELIVKIDHWIAFVLLGLIGCNMIREACGEEEEVCHTNDFAPRTMLLLAIATSIDALAIGISFAFLGVEIWNSAAVIGLTTCLLSMVGIRIGHHFGNRFKSKAEILGGVILIIIGVKILTEHTLMA